MRAMFVLLDKANIAQQKKNDRQVILLSALFYYLSLFIWTFARRTSLSVMTIARRTSVKRDQIKS